MSSMNSRQCHVSANPIDIFSIFERSNLRQNKLILKLSRLSTFQSNYERVRDTRSTFRVAEMELRVYPQHVRKSRGASNFRKQKSSSTAKFRACEVNEDWEEEREIDSAFSNLGSIRRFNR